MYDVSATQKRVVNFTITLEMEFPADWDDSIIDFYLNDSSWCSSNVIDLLESYDKEHGCICNICDARVAPKEVESDA